MGEDMQATGATLRNRLLSEKHFADREVNVSQYTVLCVSFRILHFTQTRVCTGATDIHPHFIHLIINSFSVRLGRMNKLCSLFCHGFQLSSPVAMDARWKWLTNVVKTCCYFWNRWFLACRKSSETVNRKPETTKKHCAAALESHTSCLMAAAGKRHTTWLLQWCDCFQRNPLLSLYLSISEVNAVFQK